MLKESIFRLSSMRSSMMLTQTSYRCASNETLKDKEKGDERIFFTKQDGKLIDRGRSFAFCLNNTSLLIMRGL